jgi:outer membrane lipase/esterase
MIAFKRFASLAVIVIGFLTAGWAQAIEFKSIVVFGGSVSDPGNFFALFGISNRPPYSHLDDLLVPTGPYTKGGNHFSNGATWIEQLGKSFGLNRNVQPAFLSSSPHATNYAVGGARSTDVDLTFDLPEQVGTFLAEHGNVAPSDALYVVDFGGNDVRDALGVWILTGQDDVAANAVIDAAIASIQSHVNWLSTLGASKFLFVNVADIGSLPSVQILDALIVPGAAAKASQLTDDFNDGLDDIIASLSAGAEVAVLDVFGTVNQLITTPFLFGLTNVVDACVTPNVPPFSCKRPDEFLFWDGIHPTKAVHAIFAAEAANVLGP